jgi:hypothetical protein
VVSLSEKDCQYKWNENLRGFRTSPDVKWIDGGLTGVSASKNASLNLLKGS